MKLKTLLQTFIFSHIYRIASKAKSLLENIHFIKFPLRNKNKNKQKLFFGSFRLHYNWCSTSHHVMLQTRPNSHLYAVVSPSTFEMQDSNDLSKYLQWLEEKGDQDSMNEIDKLADLFIADCHEKFRLEKQESYRMFQEMMARSI
ncbi:hypothetical protein ACS0TY_033740 [Phlomoides rotata]